MFPPFFADLFDAEHRHRQTVHICPTAPWSLVAVDTTASRASSAAPKVRCHGGRVLRSREIPRLPGGRPCDLDCAESLPSFRSGSRPRSVTPAWRATVHHGELALVHAEPLANIYLAAHGGI